MPTQGVYDEYVSAQIDLTSAAKTAIPPFLAPIDVYRWGLALDALLDVGAGFSITMNLRVTIGSDTGDTDAAVGTYTTTSDVAAGTVVWLEPDGTIWTGPLEVDSSEQLAIEVTDAADTAGTGHVIVQYRRKPFTGARGPDKTLVTEGTVA